MILTLLHISIDVTALVLLTLYVRLKRHQGYLFDLLNKERAARIAADSLTTSVVVSVEPLLQKTAWSMGELRLVRNEEVQRNALIDRVRRDLSKFNLPDPTKGGSYGDLALLKPDTRGGQRPNRPYAEGSS